MSVDLYDQADPIPDYERCLDCPYPELTYKVCRRCREREAPLFNVLDFVPAEVPLCLKQ